MNGIEVEIRLSTLVNEEVVFGLEPRETNYSRYRAPVKVIEMGRVNDGDRRFKISCALTGMHLVVISVYINWTNAMLDKEKVKVTNPFTEDQPPAEFKCP